MNESQLNKEKESNDLKNEDINKNNLNEENKDTKEIKHQKCVPLEIYQKVYNDKQKLLEKLDIINNQLKSQLSNEKINIISSLQNKIKIIEQSNKSLETIVLKQEESVINLKAKVSKYEKLLNQRAEDIIQKDNIIDELKEKIGLLIENNKNIRDNIKMIENNEINKMKDIINNLKNELEIKQKKIELNNNKFNNLQIKYLKLVQLNKKNENDFLLKLSKEQLLNKSKYNFDYFHLKTFENDNELINNLNININRESNLPKIFDKSLSISVNKENHKHSNSNKIINIKKSFDKTNNNKK